MRAQHFCLASVTIYFFFLNVTLFYIVKILSQIIFVCTHPSQSIFFSQNSTLDKKNVSKKTVQLDIYYDFQSFFNEHEYKYAVDVNEEFNTCMF